MAAHLWFFSALFAAVFWGIAYVISEKLLRAEISPAFLVLTSQVITIPIFLIIVLKMGNIREQTEILTAQPFLLILCVLMSISIVGGELLSLFSIAEKNATLASLVEISYPIFVFIFSWIFLKEIQINWQQAMGGILIFIGISIIYFKT